MTDGPSPGEVPLEGGSVVISDLHLDPERDEDSAGFADWIGTLETPRLLILGDLFDYWVGPFHQGRAGARVVLDALKGLTDGGARLELLHGNRDFLLDAEFEGASGGVVHPGGVVGRLEGGERVLFLHGDELCTRDLAYQRLRRITHSRWLRALGPRLPHWVSSAAARRLRRISQRAVAAKLPEEKAIQREACRDHARRREAGTIVCGHAHEPRDEGLEGGVRWIVLGAFGEPSDLLRIAGDGTLELETSGVTLR